MARDPTPREIARETGLIRKAWDHRAEMMRRGLPRAADYVPVIELAEIKAAVSEAAEVA